jgi:HSP20 family protein
MKIETASDLPFKNLGRQMSKVMDQLQKGYFSFCPGETWTPDVNLYESEAAYLVCVDLAGVDKDKIDLEVVDMQLRLRGARTVPAYSDEGGPDLHARRLKVHLMEIDHGPFTRSVDLPLDVEQNNIVASYRNGMLWIELPKKK